jgi:hypothetical protein
MEIKITISDTAGGGATPAPSMQISSEPGPSGASGQSSAPSGQQVSAPPEILRAAAAVGAIDAGPAPGVGGSTQFGVPPPFRSSSGASDLETAMPSTGTSAGQAAAAGLGGGSPMETESGQGEESTNE